MFARVFAIPAGLVLVVLVGAAMFNSDGTAGSKNPSSIGPGQAAPHEDRGLCAACHLLGGPAAKDLTNAAAGNAAAARVAAPAIRSDQIRPHGERGSCVNCHTILSAPQITAAADQLVQMAPAIMTPAIVTGPYAVPGQMAPGWNGDAQPLGSWGNGAQPQGQTQWGMQNGTIAPPIAVGATPPHGWRGDCTSCHNVVGANPTSAWSPTPPLSPPNNAQGNLARGPRETEALGMAVRLSTGDVGGMTVVELEGVARKGGIKLGDIVRAIDGQITTDIASFREAARGANIANGVVVDVLRDGQAQALILK